MKKIFFIIVSALLVINTMAQSPANRSVQTIIADALAQMPPRNGDEYTKMMKDLASTGEEGILSLVGKLNAPSKGSNANIEYALNGISHYVRGANDETLRTGISAAFSKALKASEVKEIKQFIITQLQIVGKDEAVDALAPLIGNPELSDYATRALASIGSEKAGQALKTALMRKMGTVETQRNVVRAIGATKVEGIEELLLGLLPTDDEALRGDVLSTLSYSGGANSLPLLAAEAEKVNYGYEKTGATDSYMKMLYRLFEKDSSNPAYPAAALKILKSASQDANAAKTIALGIYARSAGDDKAWKEILNAWKSDNATYRQNALIAAVRYLNNTNKKDKTLTGLLKKEKDPKRTAELLNIIASQAQSYVLSDYNRATTLLKVTEPYLKNANPEIRSAALAGLYVATNGKTDNTSFISKLIQATDDDDQTVVNTGANFLKSIASDKLTSEIGNAINSAGDKAKIAFLDILASRRATDKFNIVQTLAQSGSPEVKTAAFKALAGVATAENAESLAFLALNADKKDVPYIQQAGIAALSSLPAAEQISLLKEGMNMAGDKKYRYYLPLATTGDKSALTLINEGFKSQDKDARDAAFDALLNWKGADAAERIYDVLKNPSASEYFNKAFATYVQKVSNISLSGENRLIFLRKAMEIAKTDEQKNTALKQIGQAGTFLALLYAGEFLDIPALKENAAQAVMNIALNHTYYGENVAALLKKASTALSNPDAGYQRESIKKYLNEMPDDKGFVSIFNSKDLTGWKGLLFGPNDNPIKRAALKPAELKKEQEKADESMRQNWVVENGALTFLGHGNSLATVKQYADFEMYVDWNLDPAGPEADAGIYLRGTPQVQIWDTSRTNVGAQVGSGGLYNNQKNPSKPLKVADNQLGEWNTLYIKMIGDRVTVRLNGELVVDNVILENYWDRSQAIFPIEQIELQAHGSKVYYRNLYIREIERPKAYELSAKEKTEGFKILFDGTNMHEWTGDLVNYQLEDGCISVKPKQNFGGNLYTKNEYANFAFRFEFQLTPAANNGVGIRAPIDGDNAYNAMEIQILDGDHPVYKDIKPYQHHGSVYGVIAAEHGAMKPVGEWNEEEIYADGDRIRVTLNGKVILDGNIREASKNGTADHNNHPGLLNPKGHIGFLGHGSELKFRNIRIKEL
ncbi:MAG: DUF1080 domain-containing protein [Dysgonamonadaceae bacterium]|jgi:hypothetical protein|nr:DUF1080 domain-containing protein [Dysgonamonadaceae bacterium]